MITLAMDCATETVGLALLNEEQISADLYLEPGRHRAELLLPAIERLLIFTGFTLNQIDLLVCTTGPGSFTGVRIGVSTVKGLALATGKPIVGVSTLEALAMNAFPSTGLICVLIDARRDQVFAGLYRMGQDGFPETVASDRLTDINQLMSSLPPEKIDFVGDGAFRYKNSILASRYGCDEHDRSMRNRLYASTVGLIGIHRYHMGLIEHPLTFAPKYFRLFECVQKA